MKIGTFDIKSVGAKLLTVDMQSPAFEVNTEWIDGSPLPVENQTHIKYGSLKLSLLLRGRDRNEIVRNSSILMSNLTKVCELELDGYRGTYRARLISSDLSKTSVKTRYFLYLEFEGYLQDKAITEYWNGGNWYSFTVKGTRETPCYLKLTPLSDWSVITISGFASGDITLSNLEEGIPIVIDSELGRVTSGGHNAFDKVDLWKFPTLAGGRQTVLHSTAGNINIELRYKPMWM